MSDAHSDSVASDKIASLAGSVFALSREEAESLQRTLTSMRMEKDRADAERIATLMGMPDLEIAQEILWECTGQGSETYPARALQMLHEAGFVRHRGLVAAYRAGFEASSEGWNGEHPGDATDDARFVERMQEDIETIHHQHRKTA
ncbi:hypothetical protein [Methylobacterium sp. Leaf117]|uniref:hypothetical protein n=1 Tax=Methylobacterium sp. Leaf117 TaxID=1736260 RepID=UPI0006FB0DF7|nr:hypothetical protein [Methylobacterium sp. Leaf117]KQP90784.1 hypothetical protein ASF57_23545 [Methylobacterium sp. Leaf117]